MCGIVGGVGKFDIRDYLLNGLRDLDYRGYDSAGIAFSTGQSVEIYKTAGTVDYLDQIAPKQIDASAGIGHTRWATHGEPSKINAHPQESMRGNFAIVHNGVIENYRALKNRLLGYGYTFKSETDTEVIANLLEHNFRKNNDVLDGIRRTIDELQGSYAVAIVYRYEDEKIYFMKNRAPLLIGVGKKCNYLASDAVPMIKQTQKFIDLDDCQYGFISPETIEIYLGYSKVTPSFSTKNPDALKKDLEGYPHYMLKEIEETPEVIRRLIDNYYDGKRFLFEKNMLDAIRKSDDVVFIACGTSYHASLLGKRFMLALGKRSEAYIASEWAYYPVFTSRKPIYILLSQSGETADLIKCQKIINDRGAINVTITNTKGSTLERDATFSCLLYAGLEVAVASTKAYSAQVSLLALLIGALEKKYNIIDQLYSLNDALKTIKEKKEDIHKIAIQIKDNHDVFFLGRGGDYDAAFESSLKLKEITYIHSEALAGGELKHGPIALIEKGTPVFGFISDISIDLAMRGNFKEVEARGAVVFSIATEPLKKEGDAFVVPLVNPSLAPLCDVYFAQYLAYYTALEKEVNIDKPRNLAKAVTVE